jgi:hypothetical protein
LSWVAESGEAGEILKRALEYPGTVPERSFLQVGTRTLELPAEDLDLRGRTALLAYGSNAAPAVLARKLASLPELPLPLIAAELEDFDVVYSAHISAYGSVPATLQRSPGTVLSTFVVYPTAEQLRLLSATEPNYELRQLTGVSCQLASGKTLMETDAYVSRHGFLTIKDSEVALSATHADGRRFQEMSQRQVLEHVRSKLSPNLDLKRFAAHCTKAGGIAPLCWPER